MRTVTDTDGACGSVRYMGRDARTAEPMFGFNDARRLWCLDNLLVRVFLCGPAWRRHFGVEQRSLEDVRPPWADQVRVGRRWVLCFTLEDDVRERVLEDLNLGPNVAEWSDPRDWLITRKENRPCVRRYGRSKIGV